MSARTLQPPIDKKLSMISENKLMTASQRKSVDILDKFKGFDHEEALRRKEDDKNFEIIMAQQLNSKAEYLKQLDRRFTKEKSKRWKKFSDMNEDEKRERIKYLWRRVRIHVRIIGSIKTLQMKVEDRFLDQFAQETGYTLKQSTEAELDYEIKDIIPKHLISELNSKLEAWRVLLGLFTLYSVAYGLFYNALDGCNLIKFGTGQIIAFSIIEVSFLVDMVVNFFVVPKDMEDANLKNTAKNYLSWMFLWDFIATIVSNLLCLIPNDGNMFAIGMQLKLARIFRRGYMILGYTKVANCCARQNPNKRNQIVLMFTYVVELLFWLHVMTCVWIALGAGDCSVDEGWESVPEVERSWMFVEGSDFDGALDQRTIYEQVKDETTDKGIGTLYVYSLYFILTVVTTVGYGHASYQSSNELLYIIFLEVVATISQAVAIIVLSAGLNVGSAAFNNLLEERLDGADKWLVFRLEAAAKNGHLSNDLARKLESAWRWSFSKDHNMIVEEFDFYEKLTPKMQSELVETIFFNIIAQFSHIFAFCEDGFRNELII